MKNGNLLQFMCIALFIVSSGCTQMGFVKTGKMIQLDNSESLIKQAESANHGQYKIEYKKLETEDIPLLDDIPIGAIIPFFGPWTFSDKWQVCMGQIINDPDSPLYGVKVPDLNGVHSPFETVYLAGTLDTKYYGKQFGSTNIPIQENHKHGATLGRPSQVVSPDRNSSGGATNAAGPGHTHTITINESGSHDHGGENRPRTFGLVYLIRVK